MVIDMCYENEDRFDFELFFKKLEEKETPLTKSDLNNAFYAAIPNKTHDIPYDYKEDDFSKYKFKTEEYCPNCGEQFSIYCKHKRSSCIVYTCPFCGATLYEDDSYYEEEEFERHYEELQKFKDNIKKIKNERKKQMSDIEPKEIPIINIDSESKKTARQWLKSELKNMIEAIVDPNQSDANMSRRSFDSGNEYGMLYTFLKLGIITESEYDLIDSTFEDILDEVMSEDLADGRIDELQDEYSEEDDDYDDY